MTPATCEVAVVGAGIAGVSVALELVRRGVDVELLDRGAVSGGTTGLGEGNVLCARAEPGPRLELTRLGQALYREIEDDLGAEARIRRKGALVVHRHADRPAAGHEGPAARDEGLAPGREHVARMRAAGVPCSVVEGAELRALEPRLAHDVAGAERFPDDLQCDARSITRALARELERRGGRVRTGVEVRGVRVLRGRVTGLATAEGPLSCRAVVLAAGPWSAPLATSAGLDLPVEPRKGQLALTGVAGPAWVRHKLLDGAYAAAVASDDAALRIATVVETTWDGRVIVGSSRERRGFDLSVAPGVTAAMVEHAAGLVPEVAGLAVERAWAGLRPFLPDHRPAVGPSRVVDGLWASTGHEGAGVALGPISGRLVAQALCGEPPALDLEPFAVDRFHGAPRPAAGG